jgi:hypothetical protein
MVSIEDSGQGFNHVDYMNQVMSKKSQELNSNEGISLVYELSESLRYHGKGNRVEAILSGQV